MLPHDHQNELVKILRTEGFTLSEESDPTWQLIFWSFHDENKLEIKIITNLPQPFISIRLNGHVVLNDQPDDFHALKKVINKFFSKYFEE